MESGGAIVNVASMAGIRGSSGLRYQATINWACMVSHERDLVGH